MTSGSSTRPGDREEQPEGFVVAPSAAGLGILAPLDEDQRAAVLALRGPVLVVAGPGTGKTRVLAHRLAYLNVAAGIPPRRILAVTRDDETADRLRERATRLLGSAVHGAWIGPAAAISQRILRAHAAAIGRRPTFRVLRDDEARTLMRRAAREAGIEVDGQSPARLRDAIARARGWQHQAGVAALQAGAGPARGESQLALLAAYERVLAAENALDPADVLIYALRLLDENPALRDRYHRRFQQVLIDALEDTSRLELELIRRLVCPGGNILAVGDDDQSVRPPDDAGWRALEAFLGAFEGATVLSLGHGHRCTRRILYVAERLIRRNPRRFPRAQVSTPRKGARVISVTVGDEAEEAAAVVRWIQRLTARGEASLFRTAIVHRQGVQARPFEEALARAGLPYRVVSGPRFWERREIRDLMSYLRLAWNDGDPVALARVANVPRRGIGPASVVTIARLQRTGRIALHEAALRAAQLPRVTAQRAGALADLGLLLADIHEAGRRMTVAELVDFVVDRSGYGTMLRELSSEEEETRREGIDELRGLVAAFPGPAADALPRLFDHVAATGATPWTSGAAHEDEGEPIPRPAKGAAAPDGVQLLTYRQAKGREFDVVFLTGLEEGTMPHGRALREGEPGIETERRLLFLGLTRARLRAILTRALVRTVSGEVRVGKPSRFLAELGRRARHFRIGSARPRPAAPQGASGKPSPAPGETLSLAVVRPGQRVAHPRYGTGIVVSVLAGPGQAGGAQETVTVRFDAAGEKKLLLALAHLRPA